MEGNVKKKVQARLVDAAVGGTAFLRQDRPALLRRHRGRRSPRCSRLRRTRIDHRDDRFPLLGRDRRLSGHRRWRDRAAARPRLLCRAIDARYRGSQDGRLHFLARASDPDRRFRGYPAAVRQRDPGVRRQEFLPARGYRQGGDRAGAGEARASREPLGRLDAHHADRQASSRRHRPRLDRVGEDR